MENKEKAAEPGNGTADTVPLQPLPVKTAGPRVVPIPPIIDEDVAERFYARSGSNEESPSPSADMHLIENKTCTVKRLKNNGGVVQVYCIEGEDDEEDNGSESGSSDGMEVDSLDSESMDVSAAADDTVQASDPAPIPEKEMIAGLEPEAESTDDEAQGEQTSVNDKEDMNSADTSEKSDNEESDETKVQEEESEVAKAKSKADEIIIDKATGLPLYKIKNKPGQAFPRVGIRRPTDVDKPRNPLWGVHCVNCRNMINPAPIVKCMECKIPNPYICVPCFRCGVEFKRHKRTHKYMFIDPLGPPVFNRHNLPEKVGIKEDMALLDLLQNSDRERWAEDNLAFPHISYDDALNRLEELLTSDVGNYVRAMDPLSTLHRPLSEEHVEKLTPSFYPQDMLKLRSELPKPANRFSDFAEAASDCKLFMNDGPCSSTESKAKMDAATSLISEAQFNNVLKRLEERAETGQNKTCFKLNDKKPSDPVRILKTLERQRAELFREKILIRKEQQVKKPFAEPDRDSKKRKTPRRNKQRRRNQSKQQEDPNSDIELLKELVIEEQAHQSFSDSEAVRDERKLARYFLEKEMEERGKEKSATPIVPPAPGPSKSFLEESDHEESTGSESESDSDEEETGESTSDDESGTDMDESENDYSFKNFDKTLQKLHLKMGFKPEDDWGIDIDRQFAEALDKKDNDYHKTDCTAPNCLPELANPAGFVPLQNVPSTRGRSLIKVNYRRSMKYGLRNWTATLVVDRKPLPHPLNKMALSDHLGTQPDPTDSLYGVYNNGPLELTDKRGKPLFTEEELTTLTYSSKRQDFDIENINDAEQIMNTGSNVRRIPIGFDTAVDRCKMNGYQRVIKQRNAYASFAREHELLPGFMNVTKQNPYPIGQYPFLDSTFSRHGISDVADKYRNALVPAMQVATKPMFNHLVHSIAKVEKGKKRITELQNELNAAKSTPKEK